MAECSELGFAISDIALNFGSRGDVKSIGDIVRKMNGSGLKVSRDNVVEALVAANKPKIKRSDVAKNLSIIGEARADVGLKKKIAELEEHLSAETLPGVVRKQDVSPEEIKKLREVRDELRKQLRQSEPAMKQRIQKSINLLEQRLREGISLPIKAPEVRLSKELERLTFDRDLLRSDINQRIKALKPRSLYARTVGDTFDFARTIMTSGEFSAVKRQGGFISFGNPIRASKSLVPMFKSVASDFKADQIMKEILARNNAPLYAKYKISMTSVGGKLSPGEEVYKSVILDNLQKTQAGRIASFPIKASERAYVIFLNKLRADSFDAMTKTLAKSGNPTDVEYKAIADFVNSATGRGEVGSASNVLSQIFFAPRYLKSRIDLITLKPLRGGTLRTKKLIAKEYAKYLLGVSTFYGLLAYTTGAAIESVWNSSDFGKVRIGNTRIDPLSGLSQTAVIIGRLVTGKTKSTVTGKTTNIRASSTNKVSFGRDDAFGVFANFTRSKFAPALSTFFDVVSGKNVIDQPTTPGSVAKNLLIPMTYGDIADAMEEMGVTDLSLILSTLNMFGMGLQTYGPTTKKARRERAKKEALR